MSRESFQLGQKIEAALDRLGVIDHYVGEDDSKIIADHLTSLGFDEIKTKVGDDEERFTNRHQALYLTVSLGTPIY